MPKIRHDEISIYVLSGGYVVRPFRPTKITLTVVKARHVSGSIYHKIEDEVWVNSGTSYEYNDQTVKQRKELWQEYLKLTVGYPR